MTTSKESLPTATPVSKTNLENRKRPQSESLSRGQSFEFYSPENKASRRKQRGVFTYAEEVDDADNNVIRMKKTESAPSRIRTGPPTLKGW
jgi:hypothetical protein